MSESQERQPPSLWLVLALPVSLALTVIALVFGLLIAFALESETEAVPTAPSTLPEGYEEGARLFASQGCGGCHALAAAGSTGSVGPSLDAASLSQQQIAAVVTTGRGAMPGFGGRLSDEQIERVAVYVATAAGSP